MLMTAQLLEKSLLDANPEKSLRRAVIKLAADGVDKTTILSMLDDLAKIESAKISPEQLEKIEDYVKNSELIE